MRISKLNHAVFFEQLKAKVSELINAVNLLDARMSQLESEIMKRL